MSCAALIVAIWATNTALETLKNQRTTNDVTLALNLFDKINSYWDMAVTNPSQHQYYLGQILSYFETAAGLFNRKVLSRDASEILRHHIVEVWAKMLDSKSGNDLIEQLKSSTTTFDELNSFFNENQSKALADITHRTGNWDSPS